MKLKVMLGLLGLIVLFSTSGCVVREGRGGDWDHHWQGYGHAGWEEHHDHDWH